ncbi:ABC transporter [Carnobacterium gallinarum]|uniref:ABC transporter n=1 Tax=Carnobacterium gallinarum TaxID=2749 RepID=UPI0005599E59|nr:ABC transporter [Carnobacterium gallinarum]
MKKTTKKLMLGLLCGVAVLGLAACGSSGDKKSAGKGVDLPEARFKPDKEVPSWQKDTDQEATIKWYVNFDWYAPAGWGKDVVTRKIKEDMNINVEFIVGNDEKLNTMMASGDLPDIMTFDRQLKVAQDAEKFAIPLSTLAEKYDPYFLENAAKKDTLKWYTKDDGQIYTYPSFSVTQADYDAGNVKGDQALIVRKDIYEAIGKPDMSTPEGFLKALELAKVQQPKTDDGADMIQFSGTAMDIANGGDGAFGGNLQDFLGIPLTIDGEINDRDRDPEYMKWLDILRQAYASGYISNDQFSDNDNTIKEKLQQGAYFAYMHTNVVGLSEFLSDNNKRNPAEEYIAIDGPKNSNGKPSFFNGGGISGWTNTFVTKETKEPQKAMEIITYLASEYGNMVQSFGIEGETYNLVDDKAVLTKEILDLKNNDFAAFNKEIGTDTYWFVADSSFAQGKGNEPSASIKDIVAWSSDKLEPRFETENIDPVAGTRMARDLTTMNTDRVQAIVAFIQAKDKKIGEKAWTDFMATRDNNGWKEITDTRNEAIKANNERLK